MTYAFADVDVDVHNQFTPKNEVDTVSIPRLIWQLVDPMGPGSIMISFF